MRTYKTSILYSLFLITFTPLALAQGTYTQIDVPRAFATLPHGINKTGLVSGFYIDTSYNYSAFLWSAGIFTTFSTGMNVTAFTGLNDNGVAVGYTYNYGQSPKYRSFSFDTNTHLFQDFPLYSAHAPAFPFALNDGGTVVGTIQKSSSYEGFELEETTYSKVRPTPGSFDVFMTGINDAGKATGHAYIKNFGLTSFACNAGTCHNTVIPGQPYAVVYGINDTDGFTGVIGTGVVDTLGFSYQKGIFQELQFPGATTTTAIAISNVGQVAGYFIDACGNTHGFLWTPADAPSK